MFAIIKETIFGFVQVAFFLVITLLIKSSFDVDRLIDDTLTFSKGKFGPLIAKSTQFSHELSMIGASL
jgi:hypothetical protein